MALLKPLLIGGIGLPVAGGACYACFIFMQPKNLREDLVKQGHKTLSTEKIEEKEKDAWTKLVKEYAKDNNNSKINGLTISNNKDNPTEAEIKQLQVACKGLFQKKKEDSSYANDLSLAKSWCIEKSEKIANSGLVGA